MQLPPCCAQAKTDAPAPEGSADTKPASDVKTAAEDTNGAPQESKASATEKEAGDKEETSQGQ